MKRLATYALTVALAALFATPTYAATKTVRVTGTVAHVYGTIESSPPCFVTTFYRWASVPGTERAEATYLYTGTNGTGPISTGTKASPFDDRFNSYGYDAFAPAGWNQLYAGYASHQGTGPRDCSQDASLQASRSGYAATAVVTLTINKAKTPACRTAKTRFTAQGKVVRQLRRKVAKADGTASEKPLRAKLKRATERQKTLRKQVSRSC